MLKSIFASLTCLFLLAGSAQTASADGIGEMTLQDLGWVDKTTDCYGADWDTVTLWDSTAAVPVLHKRGKFSSNLNWKMVTANSDSGIWDANSSTPTCHLLGNPWAEGHDSVRVAYEDCETGKIFNHWVDIWVPADTTPDGWAGNHYMGVSQAWTSTIEFENLGDALLIGNNDTTMTQVFGAKTTALFQVPTIIIADFFEQADWNSDDPDCYDPPDNEGKFGYSGSTERAQVSRIMSFVTSDSTNSQDWLIWMIYRKAITVLARVLEDEFPSSYPNGYFRDDDSASVGGAVITGSSKRGYGVWKVAELDDRIAAIMSCAFSGHDFLEDAELRASAWTDSTQYYFYKFMQEDSILVRPEFCKRMPINTDITWWEDEFNFFEPARFAADIDSSVWIEQVLGSADHVAPNQAFPLFEDSLAVLHAGAYNYVYSPGGRHSMGTYSHVISWWQLMAHFASDMQREFTSVTMDTVASGNSLLVGAKIHFPEDDTLLGLEYTVRDSADVPADAKFGVGLWYCNTNEEAIESHCDKVAVPCSEDSVYRGPINFECPELWADTLYAGVLEMTSAGSDSYYVYIDRPDSANYKAIFVQVWDEVWPDCTSIVRGKGHGAASSLSYVLYPPEQ